MQMKKLLCWGYMELPWSPFFWLASCHSSHTLNTVKTRKDTGTIIIWSYSWKTWWTVEQLCIQILILFFCSTTHQGTQDSALNASRMNNFWGKCPAMHQTEFEWESGFLYCCLDNKFILVSTPAALQKIDALPCIVVLPHPLFRQHGLLFSLSCTSPPAMLVAGKICWNQLLVGNAIETLCIQLIYLPEDTANHQSGMTVCGSIFALIHDVDPTGLLNSQLTRNGPDLLASSITSPLPSKIHLSWHGNCSGASIRRLRTCILAIVRHVFFAFPPSNAAVGGGSDIMVGVTNDLKWVL